MAIKIEVGDAVDGISDNEAVINLDLKIRKTLDGNLMIFDHADIDIIIMPEEKRILTFPKELITDHVYGAQNRLFTYLRRKGIIDVASVQGGNVYGSMEAKILDSENKIDPVKYVLLNLSKFIEEERPYFQYLDAHLEQHEDRLTNPDNEESTELSNGKGSSLAEWHQKSYHNTKSVSYHTLQERTKLIPF